MLALRYAFRSLFQNKVLAIAALFCIAVGIGINTAVYTVVNAVVLRPLPFEHPERLIRLYTEFPSYGSSGGFRKFWMSTPELLDLRQGTTSWQSLDAYVINGTNLSSNRGEPVRVTAAAVTGGLMPSLGVQAQRGRILQTSDDRDGSPLVAVISDGLWRSAFAGDPQIVGREIKVNGLPATVSGVMPRGFAFPPGEVDPPQLWYPQQINPARPGGRANHYQSVIGLLKPGVSLGQARSELQAIMVQQAHDKSPNRHSFDPKFHTLLALPYQDEVVGSVKPALLVMLGAVAFVLLIACVNVGNLLLARAEARQHEIAVRKAVGASLWHLAKQCLAEGLLLSTLGTVLGLLFAFGALRLILLLKEGSIPRAEEITVDWHVLLFTIVAAMFTGVFFGLAPLAQIADRGQSALRSASGRSTATSRAHWLRRGMVVSELALALMLLVGAGLMVRTFWKLQEVNVGVEPARVITMRLSLPSKQYSDPASVRAIWDRLLEGVRQTPGVEAVSVASGLPPLRPLNANDIKVEGYVKTPGSPDQNVDFDQAVAPGYFEMLHIPLLEGRLFDARDVAEGNKAVIVNATFARMFYGKASPLGRRVKEDDDRAPWRTIVGVAADVKNAGINKPTGTEIYLPYSQLDDGNRSLYLLVKTARNPQQAVGAVRRVAAKIDPALPISQVQTLESVISSANARPRFLTVLLGLFSFVALALAAVGVYGVMSFTVAKRVQEFGIRMAIGASQGNVLRLVFGGGMKIGLIGVAAGLAGALVLTRFIRQLLFGVAAFDPLTFTATAVLLLLVIAAACYLPARKATRVDPIVALRYE
jgi:putative ABC transport system permease protein